MELLGYVPFSFSLVEEWEFGFWTCMFMTSLVSFKSTVYLFSFPHVYVVNMRLYG